MNDKKMKVEQILEGMSRQMGGKVSPAHYADLLILEKDPFACPPEELRSILPVATMVGGNIVG